MADVIASEPDDSVADDLPPAERQAESFGVRPGPGRSAFAAVLARPADALVALDFDGTLSPIIDRPDEAIIHPEATIALGRLRDSVGTLAIITGRPARSAVALGKLAELTGSAPLVVLGQYGAERWDASTGEFSIPPAPPSIDHVRAAVTELLEREGLASVRTEDKYRAIGIHLRETAEPQRLQERLLPPLQEIADQWGFHVEPGRAVLEIRPAGMDKGQALAALIDERQPAAVIFGGDDLGDLPAYDEVIRQRDAGLPGLLLASASAEQTALQERADVVRHGPGEVASWLNQLADALR